ncbi:hypothetical protein K461DRAFT_317978 [Myriangium duriaei CBS 260.36]|uniref:Uncharacterized protein n=1 Tax=Myriangium duriaei CBS 260.36 TaxID=1168546 RepID=A0A9P4MQ69_9PEZI|nr:hypothetical protein K461DRAFT_317978 [Myriangium duriaei CBS 260.36]
MAPAFKDLYESIVLHPQSDTLSTNAYLIFLITGNPGLVGYYRSYLHTLHALCTDDTSPGDNHVQPSSTHIYSCSLAGFETTPRPGTATHPTPYDLDQQIAYIDDALSHAHDEVQSLTSSSNIRVVLIGHSVGAYMLMEILRWRKQSASMMRIVGGICLTPTVVDLRGSPSGRKVFHIGSQPLFATVATAVANALLWPVPDAVLLRLVKAVTGMPDEAAQTTFEFLRSPRGVHQALHLLRFELAQMTTDKWDDEIWGVVEPAGGRGRTKLFFCFADDDHWVASETRDQLIAARAWSGNAGEEDRPEMEIDSMGLPHAFCLRHSEAVAEKTMQYIHKLVLSDRQ